MSDLEKAARMALEASLHDDGKWYWVRYEGLGRTYEAPALYRESAKAFYSVEFSGIPARQVEVLCEYPLAQPQQEQEPVDWEAVAADQAMTIAMMKAERKPWVGLTEEEFEVVLPYCHNEFDLQEYKDFARAIESKLKEKNT